MKIINLFRKQGSREAGKQGSREAGKQGSSRGLVALKQIVVAGFLLMLQGLAEMARCWLAMRNGVWLERLDDVRETEDMLMESTVDRIHTTGTKQGGRSDD